MTDVTNLYLPADREEMNRINRLIEKDRLQPGLILGLKADHNYFFDPEQATKYCRNWFEFGVFTNQAGFRATEIFPRVMALVDDHLARRGISNPTLLSPHFKTPLVFSLGHLYLVPMAMLHEFLERHIPERITLGTGSGFIHQTVEALAASCGIPLERLNLENHTLSD